MDPDKSEKPGAKEIVEEAKAEAGAGTEKDRPALKEHKAPSPPGGAPSGKEAGPKQKNAPQKPLIGQASPDQLSECLLILAAQNGRILTREALVAGLPLENDLLTPSLFVRAAERLGFSARIVRRELDDISDLLLPAVLLLSDQRAVILHARPDDSKCEIILPDSGGGSKLVDKKEIEELYLGAAIFVQPLPDLEDQVGAAYIDKKAKGSWFWRVLFSYRRLYTEVAVASVLINLFVLASPIFIMNVYDRVVPNQAEYTLWVLAIGVLTVFLFDFLIRMVRAYFINVAGKRADVVLASRIFAQILNLKLEHKPPSSGSFANTIREFETVRDFFSSATMAVVLDLPFLFLFLGVIYYLSGNVVFVPLAAVPIILIVGYLVQKPMGQRVKSHLSESAKRHSLLVESIHLLETIKAMGLQSWRQQRWEESVGETSRSALQTRLFSSVGQFFTMWMTQSVTVGIVIVGFYQIVQGEMTMGGLVAATILTGRAIAPLSQVANLMTRLQRSRAALKNLDAIMALEPERSLERDYLNRPLLSGSIEFRGVGFSYPGQKVPALSGVSFRIKPGEHVGLLGRVGSGKTTIQKLILQLYQPTEGSILADGIDMEQIDPIDLRANVSYVPQHATLFNGTIRDNLLAMEARADAQDLLRAADLSGLSSVVARHPQGLDMPVGEHGALLSGGQRQLVVITRALMRNANIVLFDEPTASLDNTSEQVFINKMKHYLKAKTLVLITHKIPLLSLVERLIILDEGRIIADGPKEAVMDALNKRKIKVRS